MPDFDHTTSEFKTRNNGKHQLSNMVDHLVDKEIHDFSLKSRMIMGKTRNKKCPC